MCSNSRPPTLERVTIMWAGPCCLVQRLFLIHTTNSPRGSEFLKPGLSKDSSGRNISTMPPPKKLLQPSSNGMPPPPVMLPPPPRTMPPPPPKFMPLPSKADGDTLVTTKLSSKLVPDTLIKLMEYGEDDDDLEGPDEELLKNNSKPMTTPKPFWAL